MSTVKNLAAVLALSLGTASAAHADDGFSYHLSGFGTVGYVATNTNDATLLYSGQLKGARKSGTALVDSRLGGQLDLSFSPKFSATFQGLAMQGPNGRFEPVLELGFLRYQVNSNLVVRVGRLGFPPYMVSDFRYVGYANPWVRAPAEVYNLVPIDTYEGADITWSHSLGHGFLSVQALGGHESSPTADTAAAVGRVKISKLLGSYVTYEIGNLRVRGGVIVGKGTLKLGKIQPLYDALNQVGLSQVSDLFNPNNSPTVFSSLGANYDSGRLLLTGEYANLRSDGKLLGTANGWYGTFGYRFGKVMPYASWAGFSKKSVIGTYSIPPIPQLMPLIAGVESLARGYRQHTVSLGLKMDVYNNIALKLQADHVLPDREGNYFTVLNAGNHGKAVNVYSVVVDFVF